MPKRKIPELDAQVEALAIAFVALSKFLGKQQVISVVQIPGAMKNEANNAKASAETMEALAELARRLRG